MKTPWYETSPGALQALLATRSFVYVTLYTITLANGMGTVMTAVADFDVSIPGYTWPRNAPPIMPVNGSQPRAHWKAGLDVDTWQFRVAPRLTDPITGAANPDQLLDQPWIAAASSGALDGATVQVDRAYMAAMPVWPVKPAVVGVLTVFYGLVAGIDPTRVYVDVTVNSHLDLLNIAMPRNLFQGSCGHTWADIGCTLNADNFVMNGSVGTVLTSNTFSSSIGAPPGSGTYTLGRIVMTSGKNNGFSRSVKKWAGGVFTLLSPFAYALTAGDTFMAYPGCNKLLATCQLFNNINNYGGQPYIPDAMTAV